MTRARRALDHRRGVAAARARAARAGSTPSPSGWARCVRTRRGSTRAASTRRSSRAGSRSGAGRCRTDRSSSCAPAPLDEELRALAEEGVQTLLLEGGPTLARSFFARTSSTSCCVFVAPKLAGAGRVVPARDAAHAAAAARRAGRRGRAPRGVRPRPVGAAALRRTELAQPCRAAAAVRAYPDRAPWEGGGCGRLRAEREWLALRAVFTGIVRERGRVSRGRGRRRGRAPRRSRRRRPPAVDCARRLGLDRGRLPDRARRRRRARSRSTPSPRRSRARRSARSRRALR